MTGARLGDGGRAEFELLSSERILDGALVKVDRLKIRSPAGDEFEREAVRHPGAVGIVPVISKSEVLMLRQYRAPIGGELLEIPAGKVKRGEDPVECATRELYEETGYDCISPPVLLATFLTTPGFTDEVMHLFLAADIAKRVAGGTGEAHGAEEEAMTLIRRSLEEWPRLVGSGELHDAKSIIGLMLASEYLAGNYGSDRP